MSRMALTSRAILALIRSCATNDRTYFLCVSYGDFSVHMFVQTFQFFFVRNMQFFLSTENLFLVDVLMIFFIRTIYFCPARRNIFRTEKYYFDAKMFFRGNLNFRPKILVFEQKILFLYNNSFLRVRKINIFAEKCLFAEPKTIIFM